MTLAVGAGVVCFVLFYTVLMLLLFAVGLSTPPPPPLLPLCLIPIPLCKLTPSRPSLLAPSPRIDGITFNF